LTLPENSAVTMNQLLTEKFVTELGLPGWLGLAFTLVTMLSEGALLVVAAQAGFIDGPRVLANMAHDSYVPHWFGSLSERLAARNGILLIGIAALAALWATGGSVSTLVVMYSINVFLTFSLSMIGMAAHWFQQRGKNPLWRRRFVLFTSGAALCLSILGVNLYFKVFYVYFYHGHGGGWMTIVVSGALAGTCFLFHGYSRTVTARLKTLDESLNTIEVPNAAQYRLPRSESRRRSSSSAGTAG
jgi:hypothetical protein